MTDQFSNDQRDAQIAGAAEEAAQAHIDSALKDTHTTLPGVIVSFDAAKQTCTVQPLIQRIWADAGAVSLPVCVDCPVEFPGGGGFFLTFPVVPGDECVIQFSERCIDSWFIDGKLSPPDDYRMHDLSDAIVRVGINNLTKAIAGLRTDGVELRSRDGTIRVTMHQNGTIENVNAAGSTVLSPTGQFTINAPGGLVINAPTQTNSGSIAATGDVTGQGTSLHSHSHRLRNVQAGTATLSTDAPT